MLSNTKIVILIALAIWCVLGCGIKKDPVIVFHLGDVPIEMVLVKGGTFTMGCTPEQGDGCRHTNSETMPTHSVTVSDFYISKYPVTHRLWKQVVCASNIFSPFMGDDLPTETVSWNDVQTFISKLNSMTDKTFRLPTESEWEYAARGGNQSKGYRYAGSNDVNEVAWTWGNSNTNNTNTVSGKGTQPIGTKTPNELGIYDMSGNVWEWVNDWFGDYTAEVNTNPQGPDTGSIRVIRGGSWGGPAENCHVSNRSGLSPIVRFYYVGFRLALSP